MNESKLTIWGAGTSRTIRPIWLAEELSLNYQQMPIGPRTGETQTEEYTQKNPKQKIPFLEDGNFHLSESVAICRYLLNRYGTEKTLSPVTTIEGKAKEDEWLSFIYGELDETSLYILRRHESLSSIYGEAPNAIAAAREYFQKQVAVADLHLKTHQFLVSDAFGVSDIFLTSCLLWAQACDIALSSNLTSYIERMCQRPAYQRAKLKNVLASI